MINPIRLLSHPLLLGPALMALGLWGIWQAYTVGIPEEIAYVRQGVEVEGRVTGKESTPWVPQLPAYSPVTNRMTAAYETEAGAGTVTTEVSDGYFARLEEGDRVLVLHVPGTELARIQDGNPPSPKLALMGYAILLCLGFGAVMIGIVGLLL
ncbi:MAG: DUF3592 domain-containing protein [Pseudomonadota bacterium]